MRSKLGDSTGSCLSLTGDPLSISPRAKPVRINRVTSGRIFKIKHETRLLKRKRARSTLFVGGLYSIVAIYNKVKMYVYIS